MKDFYRIHEPISDGDRNNYDEQKRITVLKTIKPICEAFEIKDYDYIINKDKEVLVIEGQEIGCRSNSIGATVYELINYIWCETYGEDRCFCFKPQVLKALKHYWR